MRVAQRDVCEMAEFRPVLKEGYLKKRSRDNALIKNWRRRYFKLYANELVYFLSNTDTLVRRRVVLSLDSVVTQTNDQGYPLCFVVKASPNDEHFYLQAESEQEKAEWATAIFDAARRSLDVAPAPLSPTSSAPPAPPSMVRPESPKRVLLHLTIQEARNLVSADLNGKSDPYCVVSLVGKSGEIIRSEEMKTNYIANTLNPEWKVKFTIGNAVDLRGVDAVHLELWDHDHITKDTSLGFVRVPLSIFQMSPASTGQSEVVDNWFRVEPPQKSSILSRQAAPTKEHMLKNHGDLHLIMSIAGPNLVDFFQSSHLALAPRNRIVNDGGEHSDNRLELTVLAAKDLISADFNNSSDPFCEFSLLDDHGKPIRGETYTTSIKYKTRNPTWEAEHHVFGMVSSIDQAAKLKVRVLDWDKATKNDPLGGVVIDLDKISAANSGEWYDLQPESGMTIRENLGAIQLKILLFGESRGERKRRLKIYKEVTAKTHEQSVEQLELENAQYDLHDAACKLDGARIACAVNDYQARHPRFYGINGCIHQLNTQIPRAHRETQSSDESFQARAGLEGQALLEVTVVGISELPKADALSSPNPYAVIEVAPSVCVEECKRTSGPLSPQKKKRTDALNADSRNAMLSKRANAEVSTTRTRLAKNEVRSEKALEINPDRPALKVEIISGHGLSGVDRGGYSDPYCTLTVTDRATGKAVESEKKKTAVVSRTLNPVWANEVFLFGNVRLRMSVW